MTNSPIRYDHLYKYRFESGNHWCPKIYIILHYVKKRKFNNEKEKWDGSPWAYTTLQYLEALALAFKELAKQHKFKLTVASNK